MPRPGSETAISHCKALVYTAIRASPTQYQLRILKKVRWTASCNLEIKSLSLGSTRLPKSIRSVPSILLQKEATLDPDISIILSMGYSIWMYMGGGGGWNAHLLKNHGGRGSRWKNWGLQEKKIMGGGLKMWSFHPPPPPHVHSNGIALL